MARQLFDAKASRKLHLPGSGDIHFDHFKNYDRFEERVKSERDPASKYIWSRFSTELRSIILSPAQDRDCRRIQTVKELNRIIGGHSIYNPAVFRRRSEETEELIGADPSGEHTARLNKLLILDAFRLELRKTQGRRWSCCLYLAGKLEECIASIVDPGNALGKWLKSVAKTCAAENKGTSWVSPSGFPVSQEAVKMRKCTPAGLTVYKRTSKIDPAQQQSKIMPNFIHSLDAAHLMKTVEDLSQRGIVDLGVIHDGYSVHACHVERVQQTLRNEFIGIYKKLTTETI